MRFCLVLLASSLALLAPAGATAAARPSVSGTVWVDGNRDGVRAKSESPSAGVAVTLERKARGAWKATRTTKTTKSGRYSFTLTSTGPFRIAITKPAAAAAFAARSQGKQRSLDSDVDALGRSSQFARKRTVVDAGLLSPQPTLAQPAPATTTAPAAPAPAAEPGGTVSGRVWREVTADGRRASDEPSAPATTVQLWNADHTDMLAATTTAADGSYGLTLPTRGTTYRVRVVLPDAAVSLAQKDATFSDADDSDIHDTGADLGFSDALVATGGTLTVDAGIRFPPPVTVTGVIWRDEDNDGLRENTESSLARENPVEVWTADRTQKLGTTTSAIAGQYSISVPYGGISVRLHFDTGATPIGRFRATGDTALDSDAMQYGADDGWTPPIALGTAGGSVTNIDAAAVPPAHLGDLVWSDKNSDGRYDPGEPGLARIPVELWDATRTTKYSSTTTDSAGSYDLIARGAGAYCLRVLRPFDRSFSPQNAVTGPESFAFDSDVDSDGWVCLNVAKSVISNPTIDAGIRPVMIVSG